MPCLVEPTHGAGCWEGAPGESSGLHPRATPPAGLRLVEEVDSCRPPFSTFPPCLHPCGLPALPGKELAEALKQNSSLTTIYFNRNRIGTDGAKAAVLSRPSLAFMWPACSAPQALAEALKQNSSLTTIYLEGNVIGVAGAKAAVLLRTSLAFKWPACPARPGTGRGFEAEQQPHHD